MADVSTPVAVPAQAAPAKASVKKATKATSSKPKPKPSHPSTAEMVNSAIEALAERNGSSLQAIKKYLAANYKLDTDKHAPFIKRYLKSAVSSETLVQTKGKGASGSFKLPVKKVEASKSRPHKVSKVVAPKKTAVKKPQAKKVPKAKAASPKKAPMKKTEKPKAEKVKPKSPSKAKKATKGPTAKPKAPKPKKTVAPKAKTSPKKSTQKK